MTFGTDIIVGFPGETEDDFQQTMTLLDEVQYDTVYSFAYSERPGTAAVAEGDPVPQATKLDRLQRLQAHQRQIQQQNAQRWVGSELEVLVEGPAKRGEAIWAGRTEHNRIVHFSGDARPGTLRSVRISAATAFSLRGEPVPMPV